MLLDLKKALDFLNHDLLLLTLKHYNVRGLPLLWLNSYLTNRLQKLKTHGCFSNYQLISAGVPQGLILGPLFFNVIINDVFQFNSASSEICLYANDTAVIFNVNSNSALQSVADAFFI